MRPKPRTDQIQSKWRWPPAKARPTGTLAFLLIFSLILQQGSCRPYLLFANKKDIRLVEISQDRSPTKATIVVKHLEDAASLDFFLQKNKVCWTEELTITSPVIRCSEIDPRRKGTVEAVTIVESGLRRPEGLACDWVNNKIYWTDSETKRIEVTSVDPDPIHRRVLFWEDIDLPRAISVAPHDGLMFWTDWGANPKIERADMNGNPASRKVIIDQDIAWPNGLTLDYETKQLFWLEAKLRYIGASDWDGNNRRIVFDEREALPQAFAISVYFSELYWTDWSTNSLNMYNFSSPSSATEEYPDGSRFHSPERMKLGGKLTPMDIKVFEPMRQKAGIAGSSSCSVNNGGCSHLCLAAPGGYTCSCPTGVKLLDNRTCADGYDELLLLAKRFELIHISLDTPDLTETVIPFHLNLDFVPDPDEFSSVAIDYDPVEGFVYWSDQLHGIFRSKLNGSDVELIISEEISHPDGVAVDWIGRNIFWIDTGNDRIEVAKLDGSSRKILISRDLDEPRDIALDPVNGWMYWSDWGEAAQIERAWMDGTHRSVIVTDEIGWPNGIAIDVDLQHLYFCDAKLDRIDVVNTDGSGRRTIIEESLSHPFGLSVLGDYIYWTDWEQNSVKRANKLTGEDNTILLTNNDNLMSVETVNTRPNPKWTNKCSKNNGGCSHLCLAVPQGRVCDCPNGFEIIAVDGVECVVPEAFLLYTRKSEIGRVSIITPNRNGYILPIKGISESSALDLDFKDDRIYWSDNEDKTINRAYLNGSHKEVIVANGLDFPDGLVVDWIAGNIYWSDTGFNRIEVSRVDGSSRRVLVWRNLTNPSSIAVDPAAGFIYWAAWSNVSVIERAALDGTGRIPLVTDAGRPNSLTIDFSERRLYWADIDKQLIAYTSLSSAKTYHTKVVINLESAQLFGLTLYKNDIYWTDAKGWTIERADKESGSNRLVVQSSIDDVHDVLVYHGSRQVGTNPCSVGNGGCSHLCLFVSGKVKCSCPSHLFPSSPDPKECVEPDQFLLFSQKNKISRLLMDEKHPDEVPDLALGIDGARDIQSIGYDPVDGLIYWIDYGSKRKARHTISIRRAFENGTLVDRILHGSNFKPYDLAVDPYSRILFWSCEQTNAINVTRIDMEDPEDAIIGSILAGNGDQPRSVALHPQLSLIFWVNIASPIRIERSKFDGNDRKVLVNSSLVEPTDLAVDAVDDLIFWADLMMKRIESSSIDGHNRRILIDNGIQGPVLIAVQGKFLYWADRGEQTIMRANKMTGRGREVVKSKAAHLSAIISVLPQSSLDNPCLRADCSHLCLVDRKKNQARCSCPTGSGLVLNVDDRTCGLPPTCKPAEFTCNSGSPACIPLQWRCDGQAECSDHSDEIGCPECGAKQFKCRNGGCVNETLVCDGVKQCEDGSDEQNCCPKEKFQCTLSGECIDAEKTCNGVNDCSDSSDELMPQCNSVIGSSATSSNNSEGSNSGTTITVTLVSFLFLCVAAGISFFVIRKRQSSSDNESNNPLSPSVDNGAIVSGTLQRGTAIGSETKISRTAGNGMVTIVNNNSAGDDGDIAVSGIGVGISGSSNGIAYDRSHVTGASSSTTSSSNYPRDFMNPPPSPATTVANSRHQMQQSQVIRPHQSMHSLPRSQRNRGRFSARPYTGRSSSHHIHHPPPPPTPYSTDFNEESDYGIGLSGPHFPSAANSVIGGYESSDAYAEHLGYNQPPPSTPQYYSDYGNETSCPPSPTPEENTFFLTQPPPSPDPSADCPPYDDDEENN